MLESPEGVGAGRPVVRIRARGFPAESPHRAVPVDRGPFTLPELLDSGRAAALPGSNRPLQRHEHRSQVEPRDLEGANSTAAKVVVDAFVCPSDAYGMSRTWGVNSYRGNIGNDPARRDARGHLNLVEEGAFILMKPVLPLSEFRDGLSNTLAFSEKPIGSGAGGTFAPYRDWIATRSDAVTASEWTSVCANSRSASSYVPNAGETWALAGAVFTHFFTSVPPNSRIPDCGTMLDMGAGCSTGD
jgi:hypothetical protein